MEVPDSVTGEILGCVVNTMRSGVLVNLVHVRTFLWTTSSTSLHSVEEAHLNS